MSSLEKITPVSRKPAAEMVAEKLLELIAVGSLKAGDTMPTEHELAGALQVSRPVVREALRGLQILGIVETRQGGRCSVTDLNPSRLVAPLQFVIALDESNVDALYEARIAVECELMRLGATRANKLVIERLDEMVAAGFDLLADPIAFRVLDLRFHEALAALAGNPFLERIAQSLYHIGAEYRRVASETDGVISRSAKEHAEIVAALRAGKPDTVAAAMRNHLESIRRTTYDAMRKSGRARVESMTRDAASGRASTKSAEVQRGSRRLKRTLRTL